MTTVAAENAGHLSLSDLIDRVAHGEEIMVTRGGKAVARIVAAEEAGTAARVAEVGHALDRMLAIRKKNGPLGCDVKELVHEGHRY